MVVRKTSSVSDPPPITVSVQETDKKKATYTFKKYFAIGRDDFCEIQIMSMGVSRKHAEVLFEKGRWWIKDLKSANGTYANGVKINKLSLGKSTKVELGAGDAILVFSVAGFSVAGFSVTAASVAGFWVTAVSVVAFSAAAFSVAAFSVAAFLTAAFSPMPSESFTRLFSPLLWLPAPWDPRSDLRW